VGEIVVQLFAVYTVASTGGQVAMARTFVLSFSDSGSQSGHYTNSPSQIGGWPVYVFKEAVVFTTLPGKDRLSGIKDIFVDVIIDQIVDSPIPKMPGPNKATIELVRNAQLKAAKEAVAVFDRKGIKDVRAADLESVSGAIIVLNEEITRVRVSWATAFRRASTLIFYLDHRNPELPLLERKRKRNFTFNKYITKKDLDVLAQAFGDTFGSRFIDDR
jgi:hypothetical protein